MSAPLRVLMVEDNPADAELVLHALRRGGYDVHARRVDTRDDMRAALENEVWELVISDHGMPSFSALGALEVLKEAGHDIPFIIVSGTIGEEAAVAAMKAGAHDFVMKDKLARLVPAVERELAEARGRRERALLQEQLFQAQKLEAIGQLASGVAHDFNNILTAILGASAFLLEDLEEGDPRRTDAEEIRHAAERAAALTRQLLAFGRKQVLQPELLDLNGVVANLEKMLRRVIGEHIEFQTQLAPSLWEIMADPSQMEQILMNLVINARDAMGEAGTLRISTSNAMLDENYTHTHASVPPGEYVCLSVTDTGCGMPSHVRDRIFEPFFTTKAPGRGTGLGLATVYGIVKQSGGTVWVYSEEGRGTTFRVYLPRAVEPRTEAVAASAGHEELKPGGETILLVEDDDLVRKLTARILEGRGFRVLAAASPREALEIARIHADAVDLLLTDVVMPEMSGPDLRQRLEALRPGIPVLFTSGYPDGTPAGLSPLGREAHFIQKPFTQKALVAKIREVLDAPRR